MTTCPACASPRRSILLLPMKFDEIDQAKTAAAAMAPSGKRGKKRKNATIARLNPGVNSSNGGSGLDDKSSEGADLRTGRWTTEETAYCDKLIEMYERGQLPIVDGIKLNDFLANMLKSKQSRLTKKMKNARLSARSYKRTSGYVVEDIEARRFSELEAAFFKSIPCSLEKSEIRFHMEKEWRELYSSYCVAINQKLDADEWLNSVEEMDRRASQAKDAARMARRKVMMGYALSRDSVNANEGIFIDPSMLDSKNDCSFQTLNQVRMIKDDSSNPKGKRQRNTSMRPFSSPFVGRVVHYLQRHNVPFEHVDAWVPSFVPSSDPSPKYGSSEQKCRLCFAGCASTETQIVEEGTAAAPLSEEAQFELLSFGDYSQKFSFDVGCGLPGRVYSTGVASWEQGIQKAPSSLFERCGGAAQWDIKTVLGIPVPSPNVGRIVVLMYSRHDRRRNPDMVSRISGMLAKLLPTPKWKLVVDIGAVQAKDTKAGANSQSTTMINDLLLLIRTYTPMDKTSPNAEYLPGFISLKLLLQKQWKNQREEEVYKTIIESYASYSKSGRSPADIACLVARDYMLLTQHYGQRQQNQQINNSCSSMHALVSTEPKNQITSPTSFQDMSAQPMNVQLCPQQQVENEPVAPYIASNIYSPDRFKT